MKTIGKIFSAVLTVALSAAVALSIVGCGSGSKQSSSDVTSKLQSSQPQTTRATSSPSLTSPSTTATRATGASGSTSATDPTGTTDATGATIPTGSVPATVPRDTKIIESAALAYYGLTPSVNTAVDVISAETAPDGKVFYLANVYYAGNTYPVYVAADGSGTYEPETYYEMYGMSEQLYQSDDGGYDDSYDYSDGYGYYDDYYYYDYGYGPDYAELY